MSLVTNLNSLVTRIGTEFKAIRTLIGGTATSDTNALATTSKNLVGAINEVRTLTASGAQIDDVTPSSTSVYSSNKTDANIATAVSALVASAPAALNTLTELAAALGNDANFATTINATLATKAATADVFTRAQLGADADTHDWVVDFNAALL